MGQVTLYLDRETEMKMKAAAGAEGISNSRWVASLIRQKTDDEWPTPIVELAGAWPDIPSLEEIRADEGADTPRESL